MKYYILMISTGTPQKKPNTVTLYMVPEVKKSLEERAKSYGISQSKLISGVVKFLEKLPLDRDEEIVATAIKRAFGREQFSSFLRGVGEALPKGAKAIIPDDAKEDYIPDSWKIPASNSVVIAYFAPTNENFPAMMSRSMVKKTKHKADQVIVVCNDVGSVPQVQRESLEELSIWFVPLAELKDVLNKADVCEGGKQRASAAKQAKKPQATQQANANAPKSRAINAKTYNENKKP